MKQGTQSVTRRESELIHAALRLELDDVIAVVRDEPYGRKRLLSYLKELQRQIGSCDDRKCRVNRNALALVLRNKARR